MRVNEQELRALIRDAVARHLGATAPEAPALAVQVTAAPPAPWRQHMSHGLYLTLASGGDACLIEPSVECTHCGYCQSHGH
jgi:hypothetical protein